MSAHGDRQRRAREERWVSDAALRHPGAMMIGQSMSPNNPVRAASRWAAAMGRQHVHPTT